MLTQKTIERARRQMGLYGEIKGGELDHLVSKVTGPAPSKRSNKAAGDKEGPVVAKGPRKARVWDEARGAHFLKEI